jgi:hypothetical protein
VKSGAACTISRLRWKGNQKRLGAEDAEMGRRPTGSYVSRFVFTFDVVI